ncbi:MAG: metallophosphoesterase [Myxococcales bacterium]|nr:MAG: metallophosphoesterase [Myxococcales bacterium]
MSSYRIALISDIHGNALALQKVLEDVRSNGVDQIACLGDVATLGPHPREALELVARACDFFVLGNHDEYLFDASSIREHTASPLVLSAVEHCRAVLSPAEVGFVRGFERRLTIQLAPDRALLLFHGSPDSNHADILAETPLEDLDRHLLGQAAPVMAGGHTHIQMLRQHRGRLLVNPGSVGLPFERFAFGAPPTVLPHAEYAVVEHRAGRVAVDFRRVELDRALLAEAARSWDGPLSSYLAEQYGSGAVE